ncbi:hypothetical protein BDV93DRAFT_601593 [Ceratobasidium sp. AG-I]|nr:hypothetical protein BDV93DRAFT_601593 [Ceratobasidium sp. AG-I]
MAGQKRASEATGSSTRASKSAKVNSKDTATTKKPASKASEKPASKSKAAEKPASKTKAPAKTKKAAPKSGGKGKAKPALSPEDFKSKALPLHINITQTPPKIDESSEKSDDSGFIAAIAMQPSTFSTGSYGWKGSRRLTIPLEGGADGETVTVMININATVAGSKDATADAEEEYLTAAVKEDLASDSDSE